MNGEKEKSTGPDKPAITSWRAVRKSIDDKTVPRNDLRVITEDHQGEPSYRPGETDLPSGVELPNHITLLDEEGKKVTHHRQPDRGHRKHKR